MPRHGPRGNIHGKKVSAAAKAGASRKRGRLFGKTVSAAAKRRGKR